MSLLEKIVNFAKEAGAKAESATKRDGFLSYSGETHAVGLGIYYGFIDFRDWNGLPNDYADGKNVEDNWYARGGYVFGAVLRVSIYLALGGFAFGRLF